MTIKLIILIVLVGAAIAGLATLERRSLYFPDRTVMVTPSAFRLPYEEFRVQTEDGPKIYGWWIPSSSKGSKPTILFSHGNAGNISHRLEKALLLRKTGANLVLYDYRGYGQSEGTPTEMGTYRDAEAVYRYLIDTKGIKPNQILFFGESLGCAVSTEMAVRHGGAGLILESPFTSTIDMAKRIFPWLPVRWIVRYRYDNLSKISVVGVPLLIMHSPQDEIVPFEMGQQLYAVAHEPKTLFELKGDHNGGFLETGESYVQAVGNFIRR